MASIVLPEVDFLQSIDKNSSFLVEQNGDIWRFPVNNFSSDNIGYFDLDNTIVLNNIPNNSYTLKLEDWKNPISEYQNITVNITDAEKEYWHFIPENCAPVEAKQFGIYDNQNSKIGNLPFHSNYRHRTGEKLYSFMALSDIHYPYETAAEDFSRAMAYADAHDDIKFVTISGDLTATGSIAELKTVKSAMDTYNTPIWPATGNHEGVNANTRFITKQFLGEPLYYKKEYNNDIFLFVGCQSNITGSLFTTEELQWLYEELESNRNKRCFIIEHVRPQDGCGNALGIYTNDIWGGAEQVVFENLMKHYKNAIVMHGHSHLKLYMQEFSNIANYDRLFGCHSIHVPSLAVPRDTNSIVNPEITEVYAASEGYIVDVYENGVMFKGRDFVAGEFLPIATYWLDTSIQEIPKMTFKDPTGLLNTTINKDIDLIWTTEITIDIDTGLEIDGTYCAVSDPIQVDTKFWYEMHYQDYDRQNAVIVHSYASDGTYLGFDYLYQYNRGQVDNVTFIPHEGAATIRISSQNAHNFSVIEKLQKISLKAIPSDKFTNLLKSSVESDGITPYNGGQGWKAGVYANSAGGETVRTNSKVTGFIPYEDNKVICLRNFDLVNDNHARITCYDENFNYHSFVTINQEHTLSQWRWNVAIDKNKRLITFCPYSLNWKNPDNTIKYFRISAETLNDDSIITVGEPLSWQEETVPLTWIDGIKIDETQSLTESNNVNYSVSDYVQFDKNYKYTINWASNYKLGLSFVYYDSDKNPRGYITSVRKEESNIDNAFAGNDTIPLPNNATYFRIRVSHNNTQNAETLNNTISIMRRQ